MDKFTIHGGVPLLGEVTISGAKNAALPLMAASLLAPGKHTLSGVPHLRDVHTMLRLLAHMGVEHDLTEKKLTLVADHIREHDAPYDLVKTMRASVLVMGPLVGRFGTARVSLPGGCAIGARPIDLHLKALEKMGAEITLHNGYVECRAKKLHGAHIHFDPVTVTGTENILMAAVLAQGETVLENAAREPEVTALANALSSMGAKIDGAGTNRITISGVENLHPLSVPILPDRIEAGTFAVAAVATQGDVTIHRFPHEFLVTFLSHLKHAGASVEARGESLRVVGTSRPKATDVTTAPHPGFATDLQAQFMALMSIANGVSTIQETIFENRFMHALELRRMGADIVLNEATATVTGKRQLTGAPVMATDLRASASLVIAGLAAEGKTDIHRIYHLDRGYEIMEKKLASLGARITRGKDSEFSTP